MRKRKLGRPKGSKNTIKLPKGYEINFKAFEGPKYITIENEKWMLKGTGTIADLHELLNQLEGK